MVRRYRVLVLQQGSFKAPKSIVEVRYYSTVSTPVKSRRCKTRHKLVVRTTSSQNNKYVSKKLILQIKIIFILFLGIDSYVCIVLNPVDKFGFEWCEE